MAMVDMRYGHCANHDFFLWLLLLPFLFFSFLDVPPAAAATAAQPLPINTTQGDIMQAIASLVNSESANTKWNTTHNPCNWKGISCRNSSSSSVVTSIGLSNYGISDSSIFVPLCRLDTLLSLDLSRNSFTNLSTQFFANSSCSMKEGLQSLNLSTNQLANSLSDLSGFPQLEVLDLSFNSFASRNLSADLGSFPKLRSFNTSSNNMYGDVPTSMVSSLAELVLSRNQLSGSIPPSLFKYENLTLLDLSQNKLTGVVPDNFTRLQA
jgi:Leucine-rich repeat (LRR) protein